VALKKIFDAFQNQTDAQRTFREIMYLQALATPTPHPNIIRLRNFLKAENNKDIYLVFDFMETDLHAVIRANILEPVHKQFIVYQSLKALKYCHTGALLHRDLKPSNLLLNEECILKIADFGLARTVKDAAAAADAGSVLTDYVATRWYRAPEIILGSTSYTRAVDMWALGCIVAEMFNGRPLLDGKSTVDQLEKILRMTGIPSDAVIAKMDSNFAKTMIDDVQKRHNLPMASERHRMEQLTAAMPGSPPDVVKLVCALLDIDQSSRMTVQGALADPWMKPFRKPEEDTCDICHELTISMNDDHKSTVDQYRDNLYKELRDMRKDPSLRMRNFFKLGK